jgi:hypothetical protein
MLIGPSERITRIKAGLAPSVTSFVALQNRRRLKQERLQQRHDEPLGKRG